MIPLTLEEFIMRAQTAALPTLILSSLFALGCGGVKPTGTITTPTFPYTFSGDWGAQFVSATSPAAVPIIEFLGTLAASNGVVTGGLIPIPSSVTSACLTPSLTPVPVSGTVDSSGNLTITLPVAGGTATLTAALATNVETYAAGSYKVVGGTCAMPSTAMQIAQYAPLNGTYKGTFNLLNSSGLPITGNTITVTAMLTQSISPNANGQFPVTGTISTAGVCTASITLTNAYVTGGLLFSEDTSFSYNLSAGFDPTGTTALVGLFIVETSSTACPFTQQQFEGTLIRQ
jgi:hypothetical protein